MSRTILKAGSITAILENSKVADRIFKAKDQNNCARQAMDATVVFWRSVFMPKRMMKGNEKYNAHVSKQWDDRKRDMLRRGSGTKDGRGPVAPQPIDLVFSGTMRDSILKGARVSVTCTNVKPTGKCSMPAGHAIKPNISKVLKFVPVFEYNRLCEVFKSAFEKAIVEGEARQSAGKQAKADAKTAKKAARWAKREAGKSARQAAAKAVRQKRRDAAKAARGAGKEKRAAYRKSLRQAKAASRKTARTQLRDYRRSLSAGRPRKTRKPKG